MIELAIIIGSILAISVGIPLGILVLRDVLRKRGVRNGMFWGFAPVLIIFAIGVPLGINWTPLRAAIVAWFELAVVFGLLGLYDSRRFSWAWRGLAGWVFVDFFIYLIDMALIQGKPWGPVNRFGGPSPELALLGLIVFGLPCLWFALTGRSWRSNRDGQPAQDRAIDSQHGDIDQP